MACIIQHYSRPVQRSLTATLGCPSTLWSETQGCFLCPGMFLMLSARQVKVIQRQLERPRHTLARQDDITSQTPRLGHGDASHQKNRHRLHPRLRILDCGLLVIMSTMQFHQKLRPSSLFVNNCESFSGSYSRWFAKCLSILEMWQHLLLLKPGLGSVI